MMLSYKTKFLIKNLSRGFAALAVIVIAYILLQKYTNLEGFIDSIGQWPVLVYSVYVISELLFGIIPPELFMIWSIKNGIFGNYILDVFFLTCISYLAGVVGYFIGQRGRKLPFVDKIFTRYVSKYNNMLNRFGGFLILVGAVTPIPFSGICMLVGATNYKFSRFLLIASSRFLRFAINGYIIYQAHL